MQSRKKSSPKKKTKPSKVQPKRSKSRPSGHRWAVFGGSFDPFHLGHLESLNEVRSQRFDRLLVVPAFLSPSRKMVDGGTPEERLEMVRLALKEFADWCHVESLEVDRGGVSYTIDTLRALAAAHPKVEWTLILGLDQFFNFDQWKSFAEILERVDLLVTSRPGYAFPKSREELPEGLKPMVKGFLKAGLKLASGRRVTWLPIKDVPISASEIRRKVRSGESIDADVPSEVAEYIRDHQLYQSPRRKIADFGDFTKQCSQFLQEKGAINVKAYDLREESAPSEYTIVASGTSTRHSMALAESLIREIKQRRGIFPQGVEGMSEGRWVVVDFGGLMVHIFYDFVRQEYRLEELWSKGKELSRQFLEPS